VPSVADLVEPAALEALVPPDERAAGDDLAATGAVRFVEFGPLRVLATVDDGGGQAEVELTSASGELEWSCTCAPSQAGQACRHVAATGRATWNKAPQRRT
jgi:uncharacterized Zn finger protein